MKLTPWFPGTVKPVRVGVYERDYDTPLPHYCYWNGKWWCRLSFDPDDAMNQKGVKSVYETLPWRGVAK